MKKLFFKLSFFAITCSIFLTSCENFFNGSLVREELEEAIEYANARYADITINSLTAATETILPSVGNYNTKYKRTDSFGLSFKPTEKYQFVKWVASPAESVAFDNEYSLTPTVTVLSVESPISIEPQVYIRPTVSITPKNGSAVEKNNPVIITFSHPVEATAEDLNKITIMSGGISYTENFSAPSLSDDKKVITYTAKEDNLISFSENTKDITITVPSSYYYLADETKVYMEKDVNYTYTVNNQTLTKLEITVNNTNTAAGSLNLNGKYKLNIGEKQNLLFSILQEYAFEKWIVKNADGQEVDHSTYSQFFDFENVKSNNTNIVVKKLAKDFVIEPVCIKRAQVVASTPAYEKTGVNRATDIRILFDQDMSESSIYWTEEELLKIKNEKGLSDSNFDYKLYAATNKKDANQKQYYYAYAVTTAAGKIKYYKNIEIHKRGSSESLLDSGYYGMPYFDSPSILVIPVVKDVYAECLPAQIDIEFVIKKGFVNIEGIEIAREYSGCYRTNGGYDITGPSLKWDSKTKAGIYGLKGTKVYDGTEWKLIDDTPKTIATPEEEKLTGEYTEDRTLTESEMYSELLTVDSFLTLKEEYKIQDTKTVVVDGWFEIQDDSGVAEIVLTLTPVSNNLYPNQSTEKLSINKAYLGQTKLVFGSTDSNATEEEKKKLEFDLSELKVEGIYKLGISIFDIVGNSSEVEFYAQVNTYVYYGYTNLWPDGVRVPLSIGVYCVLDNIYNCEYTVTQNSVNNNRYDIIGNKGKYYLYENMTGDDVTLYTQSKLRSVYKSDKAEKVTTDGAEIHIERTTNYPPYLIVEDLFGNLKARKL